MRPHETELEPGCPLNPESGEIVAHNDHHPDAVANVVVNGTTGAPAARPTMDPETFLTLHRNQLETSGVPAHFWETVYQKLLNNTFDASSAFSLLRVESEEGDFLGWMAVVIKEGGIGCQDAEHVYLIDHAWTFRPQQARKQLQQIPGLCQRMANLMDIATTEDQDDLNSQIESVLSEMWRYSGTYCFGNAAEVEDRMPLWYVMDEFGSRIQHSHEGANVRMVPFVSLLDGCAYSLLFPVKDLEENEELLRDYLEGPEAQDPEVRKALMNTWKHVDLTSVSFKQVEPEKSFFETSRENETLPDVDFQAQPLPTDRKLKVYAEYLYIGMNLKHPRFEMVDDPEEADILWYTKHFKDFKTFSETCPSKRINQFPFENVLTIKDLLCIVCRRKADQDEKSKNSDLETSPNWLPTTYNLKTELVQFVSYFQHRQERGLDNHWIVKPWNLARGLDMHVTPHLHHILRLPFSGPKIAQKYIHDPVLFDRADVGKVKFDIRYILLLQSTDPLRVFAYNRFWLRFANKTFDLTELDVYEKHFTVMNYTEGTELKQMFCHDFIQQFESQYPDFSWSSIEQEIFSMFRSIFEAATSLPSPCGVARSPQSRAMYASDLMLAWEDDEQTGARRMRPKILEINWGPDCKRACDYYPEYFDNVFSTLFLDSPEGQNVTLL